MIPSDVVMSGVSAVMAKRSVAGAVTVDVNEAANDDVYEGGETTAGSGAWNSVMMTKTNPDDTDRYLGDLYRHRGACG